MGREAVRPIIDVALVPAAPEIAFRSKDRVLGQAIEYLLAETTQQQIAVPVAHPIDPDYQPAGGKTAEMVVALDQHGPGAKSRRGGRRRGSRRAAADHQNIDLVENRDLARWLDDRATATARTPRLAFHVKDRLGIGLTILASHGAVSILQITKAVLATWFHLGPTVFLSSQPTLTAVRNCGRRPRKRPQFLAAVNVS